MGKSRNLADGESRFVNASGGDDVAGPLVVTAGDSSQALKVKANGGNADLHFTDTDGTTKWLMTHRPATDTGDLWVYNSTMGTPAMRVKQDSNAVLCSAPVDALRMSTNGIVNRKSMMAYSNGAATRTNRLGYVARHYWGNGPVYIEVMHAYYSNFARSRYVLQGDSKVGDGAGSLYFDTEYNGGAVNAPYIANYVYFPGNSIDQYAEIRIDVPSYQSYAIEIQTANISVYDGLDPPPQTNSITIHDWAVGL